MGKPTTPYYQYFFMIIMKVSNMVQKLEDKDTVGAPNCCWRAVKSTAVQNIEIKDET